MFNYKDIFTKFFWLIFTTFFSIIIFSAKELYQLVKDAQNEYQEYFNSVENIEILAEEYDFNERAHYNRFNELNNLISIIREKQLSQVHDSIYGTINSTIFSVKREKELILSFNSEKYFVEMYQQKFVDVLECELECWTLLNSYCLSITNKYDSQTGNQLKKDAIKSFHNYVIKAESYILKRDKMIEEYFSLTNKRFIAMGIYGLIIIVIGILLVYIILVVFFMSIEKE